MGIVTFRRDVLQVRHSPSLSIIYSWYRSIVSSKLTCKFCFSSFVDTSPHMDFGWMLGFGLRLRLLAFLAATKLAMILHYCTVHSSIQSASSKTSCRYSWAQSNLFSLLASRISWKYALLRKVQPSVVRTVLNEMLTPFSTNIL